MKKILTIAGSDCSGGAGIQADIKTITAYKMYAMSVITALTAQNTTGIYGVSETNPEFVAAQIDCVFSDIRPDAVKIGMVSSGEIIAAIAERLAFHKAENIVLDPVMVASNGGSLILQEAINTMRARLFPLSAMITPNIPEAELLSGIRIENRDDMVAAAGIIANQIPGMVLIKGGHLLDSADDLLYKDGVCHWFWSEQIDNPNTHGTGCTLSSAIACNMAMGQLPKEAVKNAKEYVAGAIKAGLNLGNGRGPLCHCYQM